MLKDERNFTGKDGEQLIGKMLQQINASAREIVERAERAEEPASAFETTVSYEEIGAAIARACIILLSNDVLKWIKDAENMMEDFVDNSASNIRYHDKFLLELSVLVYALHGTSITIFTPDNTSARSRVYAAFDKDTRALLTKTFFETADRRGECYDECLKQNWENEYLGTRLATRLNHFILGGENFGQEPLRGCDFFEFWPRAMAALAALEAVFPICKGILLCSPAT